METSDTGPHCDESPIPLATPQMGGKEWRYVKDCLDTDWVSYAGTYVDRFEKDLATVAGADFSVAMNSGTSALHLALVVAGVQPDTEVVMPAISFVAPANVIRYCGAWPTLVDVSRKDWQFDVDKLEDFLTSCERTSTGLINPHTKRRVSAILPVHLLGGMCDVDRIAHLCQRHELPLIEDGAQCLGALYKERPLGAAPGVELPIRLVTTSFNGNKIITTGGGGAVFANCETIAGRLKHLSTTAKSDALEFDHDCVGYNYRLTNVAAAIGLGQLEVLEQYVQRKRRIAEVYELAFQQDQRITPHAVPQYCQPTNWLYAALLPSDARPTIRALNDSGILCRPIWRPLHQLPAFADCCFTHAIEFAKEFYGRGILLPCSVSLTQQDQSRVISALQTHLDRS